MKFLISNIAMAFTFLGVLAYQVFTVDESARDSHSLNFQSVPSASTLKNSISKKSPHKIQETISASSFAVISRSSREPAAIKGSENPFPKIPSKLKELDVENELQWNGVCGKEKNNFKISKDFIALNIKKCLKRKIKKVDITNKSNGFTASIFDFSKEIFKTDLIPLVKGTNQLAVDVEFDSNVKLKKAVITIDNEL